jgi:protein O-GlcNAc transferase
LTSNSHSLLQQGSHLHKLGQLSQALACFREALALDTSNLEAANACATLLLELGRAKEAFQLLDFRRDAVLQDADSACNWAILAEQLKLLDLAQQGYDAALQCQPDHLRSLNNSALLAAQQQKWKMAMARLGHACEIAPENIGFLINFCDVCTAAQDCAQALRVAQQAMGLQPDRPDVQLRHAVLLAFSANLNAAEDALAQLKPDALSLLLPYLESLGIQASRFGWSASQIPAAEQLYLLYSFAAMQNCHWLRNDQLVQISRELINTTQAQQLPQDWRDMQFYALMLPLSEEQQGQAILATRRHYTKRIGAPREMPWVDHEDGRIHIVFATQNLAEHRARSQLLAWLSRMDRQRFAIHVMSNTPSAAASIAGQFKPLTDSFTEIAHLNTSDLVAQIRSKQAHLFIDTAYFTPWCRAELPYYGLTPVHIRHQSWQRQTFRTVQFVIGDAFTHPHSESRAFDPQNEEWARTVRLPNTCWMAADDTMPDSLTPSRGALGLPEQALVLCSRMGTPMVDPSTFAIWMTMLASLPQAILWLPAFERTAQANLMQHAQSAGVKPERLIFSKSVSRSAQLAQLRHADLFIDSLLFNANHGLVEALRMGVPAISCAGHNMASRLGGSIIHAAGLGQEVFDIRELGESGARQRYLQRALELGNNPQALQQLKTQLKQLHSHAPLFQANQQVAQWQSAFEAMAAQARQGAGFTGFDLP